MNGTQPTKKQLRQWKRSLKSVIKDQRRLNESVHEILREVPIRNDLWVRLTQSTHETTEHLIELMHVLDVFLATETVQPRIRGKRFACEDCGVMVFTRTDDNIYVCNGCYAAYEGITE